MPRERSAGRKPRQLATHLAGLGEQRTRKASQLEEVGPETNVAGGGGVRVESTETYPGGPAVVEESGEIAGHTDDDAHIVVEPDGSTSLVEPPQLERPARADVDGDGSLKGEPYESDPRKDADEGERKAVEDNAKPDAPGSPAVAGESMTTERVQQVRQAPAPRKGPAAP
jgi:hypothetical protein